MKKSIAIILALILSVGILAGCAGGGGSGDTEHVVILYPGEPSDRFEEFMANEFAERMLEDLNMTIEVRWLSWSDYWDIYPVMLGAGEGIDLYWDGTPNLARIINEQNAAPLDDLIAEYGQDMLKVLPMEHIQAGSKDGVIYGIPSCYASSSGMFEFVCVRQDILEAVGMSNVATAQDLYDLHHKSREMFDEIRGGADPMIRGLNRYFSDVPTTMVARDWHAAINLETCEVFSFYGSQAFEDLSRFNMTMGYDDVITFDYNERDTRMHTGLYVFMEGSVGKDGEIAPIIQANAPEAVLRNYLMAPEKPKYITAPGGEVICIPNTANNPEGAMKWLNWLYSSPENYRFAIYGVEGVDYEIVDGNVQKVGGGEAENFFYEWMFRNRNYQLFPAGTTAEYANMIRTWDDDAIFSPVYGFMFDNSNVLEIENALVEAATMFESIRSGYVDFDAEFPAQWAAYEAAGIDEYIAEVQRQVDAFLAAKD